MRIKTGEVREGKHDDKTVWICHFNKPDMNKKPLRRVPLTEAVVTCNSELSNNKRVYYSQSHFVPLGKTGKPLKKDQG